MAGGRDDPPPRMSVAPSRITLDWPSGPDYRAVGRLVLGGVAARADLPVDRVEELGLVLDTLARAESTSGRLSLEIDVVAGALSLRFGTFTTDPLEDLAVRRVVSALVDTCGSAASGGGHHVVLSAAAAGEPADT